MTEDALFPSTHAALTFAYNNAGQQSPKTPMTHLFHPNGGDGVGLGGLDGAAQAGMIRAEVAQLELPSQAVIAARFAPPWQPCGCGRACCSGRATNPEWQEAIGMLTEYLLRAVMSGCVSHYRLRRGIVMRQFGREKVTLSELADECGVSRDLAQDHNKRASAHLKAVEDRAMTALGAAFQKMGIIA